MQKWSLKERVNKIFANTKGIDIILIVNSDSLDPNFSYITNFAGTFEGSILLIKKNNVKLLTSILDIGDARKLKPKGLEIVNMSSRDQVKKLLTKELKNKKVGINEDFMSYGTYARIKKRYKPKKIIGISSAFGSARLVKDKYEIAQIKQAAKITKTALQLIQKKFKVGLTEKELANEFDRISQELGSDGPSFPSIVSFGANAAIAHHSPSQTKLKYGDLLLFDVGSKVHNYCSDITRTFIFGNNPAKIPEYQKKKDIIEIVKQAQKLSISAIRASAKGSAPDKAAQDYISSAKNGKYKKYTYQHALGHSVGIEVHDPGGYLYSKSESKIKPNMIFTAEPGIYLPGFGGARFEDDILVTKKGPVIL